MESSPASRKRAMVSRMVSPLTSDVSDLGAEKTVQWISKLFDGAQQSRTSQF